jgi:HEAT repeat protein
MDRDKIREAILEQKWLFLVMIVAGVLWFHGRIRSPESENPSDRKASSGREAGSVAGWIDDLSGSDVRASWKAARSLGESGDPRAVAPLVRYLERARHDENGIRYACEALAALKDPAAIPAISALAEHQNPRIRAVSVRALSAFEDSRATEIVSRAARDSDAFVRRAAEHALANRSGPLDPHSVQLLVADLKHDDSFKRREAARTLERIHPPQAVPALIGAMEDPDYGVRESVRRALTRIGKPAVEPVSALLLESADAEVRRDAALILGWIKDPAAVGALEKASRDSDPNVSRMAVSALNKIGGEEVIPLLLDKLENAQHPPSNAVRGLVEQAEAARPDLERMAASSNESTRRNALWTLKRIKDPRSAPVFLRALEDESPRVVLDAMEGLMNIEWEGRGERFVSLLDHESERVRRKAVEYLKDTDHRAAVAPIVYKLEDPKIRSTCKKALLEWNAVEAVPDLIHLVRSRPDIQALKAAVELLGAFKADRAADILHPLLKEESRPLVDTVCEALGEIGSKKSVLPLWTCAVTGDGHLYHHHPAIKAVQKIGRPAVPVLLNKLGLSGRRNRYITAAMLSTIKEPRVEAALRARFNADNLDIIAAAYPYYLRAGIENVEPLLIRALDEEGDVSMARALLRSGNAELSKAATAWAHRNGFQIITVPVG